MPHSSIMCTNVAFFLINSLQPHWDLSEGGGVFDFCLGPRVPRDSAGDTYVRMSSKACAATSLTWMHVQAIHPQTNSEKVMLACSVLRQIITLRE